MKLKRTRQCKKCPWRVDVDPHDIPNGYCETKHANLKDTIAVPSTDPVEMMKQAQAKELHIMACHETHDAHCVGWLNHQLGEGNNLALRISMIGCENINQMKLIGEQHKTFEETLPNP